MELTAHSSPGWYFQAWGGDASGTSNPTTVTMDSDKSVSAHFVCDGCTRSAQFPLAMNDHEHDPAGWMTIVSEDFEGPFPGPWVLQDNQSGYGEYYWGQRDCRAYQGGYSGWAVGEGATGSSLLCGDHYPDWVDSWMVYGPFSLLDATAADLQFEQWLNTESGSDSLCRGASVNGMDFYGTCVSGDSDGWLNATLDLSNVYTIGSVLGEPEVWVAMVFDSDYSISYVEGAYVDDIVLRKYISLAGQPPPPSDTAQSPACCAEITEQPMVLTRER